MYRMLNASTFEIGCMENTLLKMSAKISTGNTFESETIK